MKMVKVFVLGLLMLMIPSVSKCQEFEQTLLNALEMTDAEFELLEINDWSVVNDSFMDFEDMKTLRDSVLEIFEGEEGDFHTTEEFDDRYRIMDTEGITPSGDFLRIILHSARLPEGLEGASKTYLVVNINSQDPLRIAEISHEIRKSIEAVGGESRTSTCITGTIDGKLTESASEEVTDKIANYLKVSKVDVYSDEYTLNLAGYSPVMPEGIDVLGKKYNINIALRYNTDSDKTYLWIGAPVISSEH